eukprot:PhM_4_TR5915/c0_g1_i2/m.60994
MPRRRIVAPRVLPEEDVARYKHMVTRSENMQQNVLLALRSSASAREEKNKVPSAAAAAAAAAALQGAETGGTSSRVGDTWLPDLIPMDRIDQRGKREVNLTHVPAPAPAETDDEKKMSVLRKLVGGQEMTVHPHVYERDFSKRLWSLVTKSNRRVRIAQHKKGADDDDDEERWWVTKQQQKEQQTQHVVVAKDPVVEGNSNGGNNNNDVVAEQIPNAAVLMGTTTTSSHDDVIKHTISNLTSTSEATSQGTLFITEVANNGNSNPNGQRKKQSSANSSAGQLVPVEATTTSGSLTCVDPFFAKVTFDEVIKVGQANAAFRNSPRLSAPRAPHSPTGPSSSSSSARSHIPRLPQPRWSDHQETTLRNMGGSPALFNSMLHYRKQPTDVRARRVHRRVREQQHMWCDEHRSTEEKHLGFTTIVRQDIRALYTRSKNEVERWGADRDRLYDKKCDNLDFSANLTWNKALMAMRRGITHSVTTEYIKEQVVIQAQFFGMFEQKVRQHFGQRLSVPCEALLEDARTIFGERKGRDLSLKPHHFTAMIDRLPGAALLLDDVVSVLLSLSGVFRVEEDDFIELLRTRAGILALQKQDRAATHAAILNSSTIAQWLQHVPIEFIGAGTLLFVLQGHNDFPSAEALNNWIHSLRPAVVEQARRVHGSLLPSKALLYTTTASRNAVGGGASSTNPRATRHHRMGSSTANVSLLGMSTMMPAPPPLHMGSSAQVPALIPSQPTVPRTSLEHHHHPHRPRFLDSPES